MPGPTNLPPNGGITPTGPTNLPPQIDGGGVMYGGPDQGPGMVPLGPDGQPVQGGIQEELMKRFQMQQGQGYGY